MTSGQDDCFTATEMYNVDVLENLLKETLMYRGLQNWRLGALSQYQMKCLKNSHKSILGLVSLLLFVMKRHKNSHKSLLFFCFFLSLLFAVVCLAPMSVFWLVYLLICSIYTKKTIKSINSLSKKDSKRAV